MTRPVQLRWEAERDLDAAYTWYDQQRFGLGEEFLLAVDAAMARISRWPETPPVVHGEIRRALLRRFPYGVFYTVEEQRIVILAILHAARDPEAWPGE